MTNADPPPPPNAVASENPAELLALVYNELRRLAAAKLARESGALTLQPTALVHEAWLRLGGDAQPAWANRRHFFAAAAESMRRILIDSARRKHAARRGAGAEKVSANATGFDLAAPSTDDELLLVNDALDALATHDARKAELVKLKYFGGLTLEEAADTLGISHRTAPRSATGPTPAPGPSPKSPASAAECTWPTEHTEYPETRVTSFSAGQTQLKNHETRQTHERTTALAGLILPFVCSVYFVVRSSAPSVCSVYSVGNLGDAFRVRSCVSWATPCLSLFLKNRA